MTFPTSQQNVSLTSPGSGPALARESQLGSFLSGLSIIYARLCAEAEAKGATPVQAERAAGLVLMDEMRRRTASVVVNNHCRVAGCTLPVGHVCHHSFT